MDRMLSALVACASVLVFPSLHAILSPLLLVVLTTIMVRLVHRLQLRSRGAAATSASPTILVCSRSPTNSTNSGISSVPHSLHPDGSSGNAAVLPSLFKIQTKRGSTLHYVPKAARILWVEVLRSFMSICCGFKALGCLVWSFHFAQMHSSQSSFKD